MSLQKGLLEYEDKWYLLGNLIIEILPTKVPFRYHCWEGSIRNCHMLILIHHSFFSLPFFHLDECLGELLSSIHCTISERCLQIMSLAHSSHGYHLTHKYGGCKALVLLIFVNEFIIDFQIALLYANEISKLWTMFTGRWNVTWLHNLYIVRDGTAWTKFDNWNENTECIARSLHGAM